MNDSSDYQHLTSKTVSKRLSQAVRRVVKKITHDNLDNNDNIKKLFQIVPVVVKKSPLAEWLPEL